MIVFMKMMYDLILLVHSQNPLDQESPQHGLLYCFFSLPSGPSGISPFPGECSFSKENDNCRNISGVPLNVPDKVMSLKKRGNVNMLCCIVVTFFVCKF